MKPKPKRALENFFGHRLEIDYVRGAATCIYCFKTFGSVELQIAGAARSERTSPIKPCPDRERALRCEREWEAKRGRVTPILAVSETFIGEEGMRARSPVFFVRDRMTGEKRPPTRREVACLLWRCWRVRP